MGKVELIKGLRDTITTHSERPFHVLAGSRFSYGELDQKSAALAKFLGSKVARGTPVMIFGHKSHFMFVGIFACLRAGCAYVPADEVLPDERVRAMAKAAGCGLILNFSEMRLLSNNDGIPVMELAELKNILSEKVTNFGWEKAVSNGETAYILFTSGSTGTPKGVQISLENLEDFLSWTTPAFGYGSKPLGFMNQAPLHFDLSVYEVFNAAATGGCLYSITQDVASDSGKLFNLLEKYRTELNVWISTPSFLGYALSMEKCNQQFFPELRQFVLIGEVLPVPVAADTLKKFPKAKLHNFYGPTEATVAHTVFEVTTQSLTEHATVPIGRAKPGSSVSLIDGEMVLRGPNVSKGYINEPALTEKKFFVEDGVRCYRTGDLGSVDGNGLLFYAGRVDNQIKLNGYRIEVEDVEAHLLRVPGVQACAVVPKWDGTRVEWLAAFVVVSPKECGLSDLDFRKKMRRSLAAFVPVYMLPKKFFRLVSLPLTPSGKVDKTSLKGFL